jgi:hypothetical protein
LLPGLNTRTFIWTTLRVVRRAERLSRGYAGRFPRKGASVASEGLTATCLEAPVQAEVVRPKIEASPVRRVKRPLSNPTSESRLPMIVKMQDRGLASQILSLDNRTVDGQSRLSVLPVRNSRRDTSKIRRVICFAGAFVFGHLGIGTQRACHCGFSGAVLAHRVLRCSHTFVG